MDTHQDIRQKKDATSVICDAEGDTNHPNREEGRRRDDGRCCGDGEGGFGRRIGPVVKEGRPGEAPIMVYG